MPDSSSTNEPNEPSEGLHRREVIKGAAAVGLIAATGTHAFVQAAETKGARSDLIKRENAKPGTRDWLLTKTRTVPGKINKILNNGRSEAIEGYCSANSIRAGETLKIMVSTNPASAFKLEIFRTGYYSIGGIPKESGGKKRHRRSGFWHRRIDELAFFGSALTSEQIENLFQLTPSI